MESCWSQDVFVNVLTVLWLEKFGANPAGEVHDSFLMVFISCTSHQLISNFL